MPDDPIPALLYRLNRRHQVPAADTESRPALAPVLPLPTKLTIIGWRGQPIAAFSQ